MASKMVSLRLDEGLAEWAESYAKQRGVSRTELLESALVSFREDCEAGVPELRAMARSQAKLRIAPAEKPTREDFNRATAERADLFSRLRTPDSIKGVPKRGRAA